MSKKLAEGSNGLVLDVKTGSGAFLRDPVAVRFLAALMVAIGEHAGTRTAALLTHMDQPLGRFAGNWLEIWEAVDLLAIAGTPMDEDLRELSLILAGWMIYLGGKASTPTEGRDIAETTLIDGKALDVFYRMVEAQGGDTRVFDDPGSHHRPKFRREFCASRSGYLPTWTARRSDGLCSVWAQDASAPAKMSPRTPASRCERSSARASGPDSLCLRSSPMMKVCSSNRSGS